MNTNLSQYNEGNNNMIELIICNNDNMGEGCISALESAGYNNGTGKTIPVFGVDATDSAKELIANGKMTGTVKQDAEGMAAAIAQIAKAVGEGTALKDAVAATAEEQHRDVQRRRGLLPRSCMSPMLPTPRKHGHKNSD